MRCTFEGALLRAGRQRVASTAAAAHPAAAAAGSTRSHGSRLQPSIISHPQCSAKQLTIPALALSGSVSSWASAAICSCRAHSSRQQICICRSSSAAAVVGSKASILPPVKYDPEVKAKHKRPPGWQAPGPSPVGPGSDPSLKPQEHETLSYLTGDWRIFQLKKGHRWSMDDMMTAYVALQEAATINQTAAVTGHPGCSISHTLDIGCGIGSVLLMVAWGLRKQHMEQQHDMQEQQQQQQYCVISTGVEAQAISFQLAQRSIRYNLGPDTDSHGVQVYHQDLREPLRNGPIHQLITGTPPYIPEGSGGRSDRPQKAPCCLETRGGIEDYCTAAAAALAPGGVFVVCGGMQGQPAKFGGRRAQLAAAAAGLVIVRQVTVVTREGKPPLFAVYVMRKADEVAQEETHWLARQQEWFKLPQEQRYSSLQDQVRLQQACRQCPFNEQVRDGQLTGCEDWFVVQYADGSHSQAWHDARAAMGLPPINQPAY